MKVLIHNIQATRDYTLFVFFVPVIHHEPGETRPAHPPTEPHVHLHVPLCLKCILVLGIRSWGLGLGIAASIIMLVLPPAFEYIDIPLHNALLFGNAHFTSPRLLPLFSHNPLGR